MKIGILDESAIKKVAEILVNRPEVISVFVEGTELSIKSSNIGGLINYLEEEHDLHLVVNGNNYMVASVVNEGLAQDAASAGSAAAEKAADAGFGDNDNDDEDEEKSEEMPEEETDAAQASREKLKAMKIKAGGTLATKEATQENILGLLKLNQVGGLNLSDPHTKKLLDDNRDFFAKLAGMEEDQDSEEE